jgi:hypothetical protein
VLVEASEKFTGPRRWLCENRSSVVTRPRSPLQPHGGERGHHDHDDDRNGHQSPVLSSEEVFPVLGVEAASLIGTPAKHAGL